VALTRTHCALLAVCIAIATACAADRTQVVVVVDSDFTVPTELDGVRVEITSPDGTMRTSTGDLRAQGLPRTVTLVHEGGPLGPFRVHAEGMLAGTPRVERNAMFSFRDAKARR
jgi:hypothetical protein